MEKPYPNLFSPIRLGSREAVNRIMRTATTTNLAERGHATDAMIEFYRVLARGGAGTIVTEAFRVHRSVAFVSGISLFDRNAIPGLQRLANVVRAEQGLFIVQLFHGDDNISAAAFQRIYGLLPLLLALTAAESRTR